MEWGLGCCCSTVDPISLKAFDSNGGFLYEYWMASVFESHSGTMYGFEIRELTSANWSSFTQTSPNYGFALSSIAQPVKSGINPHSTKLKQYALDAISIDRVTGTRTLLHSNADYVFVKYDPSASPGHLRLGLPDISLANVRFTQQYVVTDDGTTCLRSPMVNAGAIMCFDSWVQSATSRYRICAAWLKTNGSPSQWTFLLPFVKPIRALSKAATRKP